MHWLIPILLTLSLGVSELAHAANTRFVTPGGSTSFAISRDEPNRISIVDDRITGFIKVSGSFSQEHDPESGDLFITPTAEANNTESVISGFLTTEKGNTIQVFLSLRTMPSTNTELQLKVFGKDPKKAKAWERKFNQQYLAVRELARAMKDETPPPGFSTERFQQGIPLEAVSLGRLSARIHSLTVGYEFLGQEIRVLNPTHSPQPLSERFLNDRQVMGVWIVGAASRAKRRQDIFMLAPGESVRVFRIKQNYIH